MGKRSYPNVICWGCVDRTLKDVSAFMQKPIPQIEAKCDICKCKGIVILPVDVGHFSKEQLTEARKEAERLGIKGNDQLSDEAINKALTIVDGVLGDKMSFWTKKIFNSIKDDFERGRKITKYDLEKLMFWFAKDVDMQKGAEVVPEDGNTNDSGRDGSPVEGRIIYARS